MTETDTPKKPNYKAIVIVLLVAAVVIIGIFGIAFYAQNQYCEAVIGYVKQSPAVTAAVGEIKDIQPVPGSVLAGKFNHADHATLTVVGTTGTIQIKAVGPPGQMECTFDKDGKQITFGKQLPEENQVSSPR